MTKIIQALDLVTCRHRYVVSIS